ncbi:DUF6988 family protein [Sideroxydans lithotrophicus]|uniref:Uncharacterized protein n=1 Tax=Sideroxydans lithotrophicus (strain ES-1) TaxID=580332 RepID=D5CSP4_SIDLE|nr:hypothetical protein [Sideroxydans lithotrophicus]ADE11980.1 hypothetical protein Slit_1749 [Sideroxydans lithotrophicus ES-1]
MKLAHRLSQGHDLAAWIEQQVCDMQLSGSVRVRLAGTCFIVAQEHHQAILLLLSQTHPLHAPAFALVRPVFEAYLRGLWLAHCAKDAELEGFSHGKSPPKMPSILSAIEQTPGFDSGQLSDIYKQSWSDMCAYAHTGSQQVLRWNTGDAIQPNYSDAEVDEVLSFTGSIALLSTLGLAAIATNESLAASVLAKAHELSYQFKSDSAISRE